MNSKKGFTLIEIIAVIVIIGIILIITIPAVSKYIMTSDNSAYAQDVEAYLETARSEYEMQEYGDFLLEDEIMIVPMENITLEKGNNGKSPYGMYDMEKSYFLIVPERNGYGFYANVTDETGVGIVLKPSNQLGKDAVEEEVGEDMEYFSYYTNGVSYYTYGGKSYEKCETRDVTRDGVLTDLQVYVFCDLSSSS